MITKFRISFQKNQKVEINCIISHQNGYIPSTVFEELEVDMNEINSDIFEGIKKGVNYQCNVLLTMSDEEFEFDYSKIIEHRPHPNKKNH